MSTLITVAGSALGALASALVAAFYTARLCLWALGVITAWYGIIGTDNTLKPQQKRPGQVVSLTATALRQHNREEAAAHPVVRPDVPPQHWPTHVPPIAGVSEMGEDESIDQWPIWGEGGAPQLAPEPAPAPLPVPPAATNHAHAAADRAADEQHVLAATTMGGNVDLVKEPPKEVIRKDPGGTHHKVKKPFFARKVEKWFVAPYAQKYERVGYMMYKGAMRVEKGVNMLGKDLDAAIREAGVAAVDRVEASMQKYIKFFGAVTVLTVLLLPLPTMHLSIGVA